MLSIGMSRKTLALVAGLTVLTLVLVVLALNTGKKAPGDGTGPTATGEPTPTVPAHTTVNLSPNPVTLQGNTATVEVVIDTEDNQVTGAQFDLVYDPDVFTVGPIRLADFFQGGVVLFNDTVSPGTERFMVGLSPAQAKDSPKSGTGTIATFTVTRKSTAPRTGTSNLELKEVYVSAKGMKPSVLREATGTTVNLSVTGASSASPSGR